MKKLRLFTVWILAFALLLSMVLVGCGTATTEDEKQPAETVEQTTDQGGEEAENKSEQTQGTPTEFKEAPMLANMVKAGNLPSLKERLPKNPKLTNEMPADMLDYEIGQYGGALRTVAYSPDWDADVFIMDNEPLINTPGILGDEFTPNIVESYEVSSDQKEFTFHLREGLKWSDGQPVTTDDIKFAYEDVLLNEELTPAFPAWLRSGNEPNGTPMKLDVLDQYTFKISFDQPYGGFLAQLAIIGWRGYTDLLKPKHYLQKFHPKYTSKEELDKLVKDAGYETWIQLFGFKDITNWELTRKEAIGFPGLYPWLLVSVQNQVYTYERNPYYFKVDAEGNQLPYIDKLVSTQVQDAEMSTMKQIAGEVDFARETMAMTKVPMYKENEKNGYKTYMANMHVIPTEVFLNQTYDDPIWRKVVRDKRFRQALNYAIDRNEIIDAVYYGFAELPTLVASEYDPEKANQLLDEMGMNKKDSEGFRLGPDGKRFTINFEVANLAPDIIPATQLVVEFWKNVGIYSTMKTIDNTLWSQRNAANELQASVMWTSACLWYNVVGFPQDYAFSGRLWWNWYSTGGKQDKVDITDSSGKTVKSITPEEPPEEVKAIYDSIAKMGVLPPDEAKAEYENFRKLMYNSLLNLTLVENAKQPFIANAKLGNVSDKGYAIAANYSGEQFFYKK
ncbi:ABC transporter substrate-binding protein [Mahella australiensis]|uniref:Extracellular solute-binding protein family 5 n=1 Tax=Mahella australiensis (strain DSM 15567 / CIP 107919 / 50-1 BON) TaxID=697281 RepID=F3ZW13_MAHA5|nr:ABC transporter substrate-binding protein [Mahella australiensis]AEE96393.1 extracellular solute-binding protein family 5 [Mahella australiensis 50-1 BON]